MNNEEAKNRLVLYFENTFCVGKSKCDGECDICVEAKKMAIEALEKQAQVCLNCAHYVERENRPGSCLKTRLPHEENYYCGSWEPYK